MNKLSIGLLATIFLMPCGIAATALNDACITGNLQEVEKLISEGAKVYATDEDGYTPLHWAAKQGHEKVVEFLLTLGADKEAKSALGKTPLHFAADNGHEYIVKFLLTLGAEVNAIDRYGWTPLHWAALKDHAEVLKILLAEGADVDATNNNGQTPLHWAALNGHAEVLKILLAGGADVDTTNNNGQTPLHLAAFSNHAEVLKILLDEKVVQELTTAPMILKQPNNANSKLSKETLKKDDDSNDEFVKLFKELPEPALKSVAKSLFPVKDNDESIIKALLKFSYQHLKENPEQQQSSFAKLFIRKFYNNHLLELKLYIAIKNKKKKIAIEIAWDRNKYTIVNYLEKILDTQDYYSLDEDLKTKTERNYKQLVKYVEAEPMEIE